MMTGVSDTENRAYAQHNLQIILPCIELSRRGNNTLDVTAALSPFCPGGQDFVQFDESPFSVFFDIFSMFDGITQADFINSVFNRLFNGGLHLADDGYSPDFFIADRIFEELRKHNEYYADSVKGLLLALLSRMDIAADTKLFCESNKHLMIYQALIFINNNYQRHLTVSDISAACKISESHLRRRFNEVLGTSPADYLNSLRIFKACRLIRQGGLYMKEIAVQTGFSTLSSFNRHFHALTGLSPSEWNKRSKETE